MCTSNLVLVVKATQNKQPAPPKYNLKKPASQQLPETQPAQQGTPQQVFATRPQQRLNQVYLRGIPTSKAVIFTIIHVII